MSLPYRQFAAALDKLKTQIPREAMAERHTHVATKALHGVVERSPVGNPALWKGSAPAGYVGGSFKNSWVVQIGGITPSGARAPDASGGASLAETAKLAVLARNPYVVTYVHNSLPYANRLEHGWSTQAPIGMVAVTVQSLNALPE